MPKKKPAKTYTSEEVENMIRKIREAANASRTIYDDRNELLAELADNENRIEHHEQCLHNAKLNNQDLRKSLARIDLAIRRSLELNQ